MITDYQIGANSKVAKFNQFYYDAYRTWGTYYNQAYIDLRAYAGDNWTQAEKYALQQQKRMVLELNKIRRVVNLYSGYERENRTSTVVAPIESSSEATADLLTEIMLYVYDKGAANHILSQAFDHSLKTGLSIIGFYIDYSRDKVNGDIKFYWKPFNALMLDPYFTKTSLEDCDQASTRDLLSRDQVKALLPGVDPREIQMVPTGIRDNKYLYLGIYRQYNSTYIAKNLLTYDQYWVRTYEPQKYIVDNESGVTQEYNGSAKEERELGKLLREQNRVQIINSHKKSVELNIIVGGQQFYSGKDPTGLDTFPFLPIITYFEPLIDTYELKIQGLVRSVRDAQRQYNRRHSQIIDLMESVINTGWITKNGAVLDPAMLFQAGAGRNIVVNDDYDIATDVVPIQPPQIPSGYLQYQDIIDKNIMEIPGGSEELLGLSSTGDLQVSGKLAEVRASNGLKGNRGIFDNFEQTKKELGDLVLQAIQKNYTPGKVQRITRKEPTPEFFSGQFEQYDCVIKQAILTQTQREAYYYQLLQMRAMDIPIPDDEIIDAAPLQGKTRLREKMAEIAKQKEEAAQQEAADKHLADQLVQSQMDQNVALAQERRARVIADIGLAKERESEVKQNNAKAFLDIIKGISEMQNMKHGTALDALRLKHEIEMEERAASEAEIDSDTAKGEQLK